MSQRTSPLLHRDDPDQDPLVGHVKVTRRDWLNMARDVLVTDGAGEIKILGLANRMGVSRSSFYWYFKDRADLETSLLDEWEVRNSAQIIQHCQMPASNITEGLCNFFRCFVDTSKFDQGLDFAVREWSRRDPSIRARVDKADQSRIKGVTALFARHGYEGRDADARARIVYFMQLGYHALEVREDMDTRMSRLEPYIRGFTGQDPDRAAVAAFLHDIEKMGLD
ncbi:TetR/AcrR family transcriptional regulator [uncultured Litoreibacter sp.]|uniref:TetR/AcrR family transcriptional regulator n=1 Tax=uncultured Litoreibacter sp. TaxID=1392394 RepID=UPI00262E0A02|nr:TetR/AcrR family transcriptional regulator [uncultured Litoreibacter sp.]